MAQEDLSELKPEPYPGLTFTKKTVKFGDSVYQVRNITYFKVIKYKKTIQENIRWNTTLVFSGASLITLNIHLKSYNYKYTHLTKNSMTESQSNQRNIHISGGGDYRENTNVNDQGTYIENNNYYNNSSQQQMFVELATEINQIMEQHSKAYPDDTKQDFTGFL